MRKRVVKRISLIIDGITYDLVWDSKVSLSSGCSKCALLEKYCFKRSACNLMALCTILAKEPDTYFVIRD